MEQAREPHIIGAQKLGFCQMHGVCKPTLHQERQSNINHHKGKKKAVLFLIEKKKWNKKRGIC